MPSRKACLVGLVLVAIGSPTLYAQVPGLPAGGAGIPAAGGAGAIPGSASGVGSAATGAAGGASGFCANLAACVQRCKAKLCASQMGQMLGSLASGPMASVTGGFLPSLCPPPGSILPGAGAPPGSAASTAAAIQASEANAKARVAAIEYLGTVDCARWPEAQKALINGLRQDPNECVRFAAARALNSGCCCSKKVIDALRICVSGEDTDGAPAENSSRVKAAAFSALQGCLMRVPEDLPIEQPPPPETPTTPKPVVPGPEGRSAQHSDASSHIATAYTPAGRAPIPYEEKLRHKTFSQTVEEARRTLFRVSQTPHPAAVVPPGKRSVFGALTKARIDLEAANHRKAREQGAVPPKPEESPVNVVPEPSVGVGGEGSPTTPAGGSLPGLMPAEAATSGTASAASAPSQGMVENAAPGANSDPAVTKTSARRGLIGMLFQPRGE